MVRSSSVNPAKVKKVIKILIKRPDMKVPQAMKLSNFSDEEVANLAPCIASSGDLSPSKGGRVSGGGGGGG